MWVKIRDLHQKYIYVICIIVALISVLSGLTIVPPVPPHVQLIYDAVEDLPEDAIVVMSADNNAGYYARHYGGQVAILRHLLTKSAKIYMVGLGYEDGPLILSKVIEWTDEDIKANNKVYGEDYVHLGYVAGFESAYAAFCRDVKAVIKQDYYGTPIEEIPMMADFNDASQIDLWIQVGNPLFMPAIRQFAIAFDKGDKLVAIGFEGGLSTFMVQMQAGNLLSGVQGSQDGVVYEALVNRPFISTAQYVGGNLLMFVAMAAIIVGNLAFYMARGEDEE
jgi:hypothetical protein